MVQMSPDFLDLSFETVSPHMDPADRLRLYRIFAAAHGIVFECDRFSVEGEPGFGAGTPWGVQ